MDGRFVVKKSYFRPANLIKEYENPASGSDKSSMFVRVFIP